VDCFQAEFRAMPIDLPGRYEVILYGPSDSVCWSSCRLLGTYESYSTGRAEENGSDMMNRKSLAGEVRLICSVEEFGADRPEIVLEFWKLAMFAAVGLFELFAKNAVSLSQ
jgi:hypothetical protein